MELRKRRQSEQHFVCRPSSVAGLQCSKSPKSGLNPRALNSVTAVFNFKSRYGYGPAVLHHQDRAVYTFQLSSYLSLLDASSLTLLFIKRRAGVLCWHGICFPHLFITKVHKRCCHQEIPGHILRKCRFIFIFISCTCHS